MKVVKPKSEQEVIREAASALGISPAKEIIVAIDGIAFPLSSFRSMYLLKTYNSDKMMEAYLELDNRKILCDEEHYNQILEVLRNLCEVKEPAKKNFNPKTRRYES